MFSNIARLREKLAAGQLCLGTGVTFSDPAVSEALADSVDFLWLDLEHNPLGLESLQSHLMAARAAELDAKRRLAEHVNGLVIVSETTVKDFVAEHDDIATHMDAILVGSMVEKTEFDNGTAHVTVSIPGMQIWEIVHERYRIVR